MTDLFELIDYIESVKHFLENNERTRAYIQGNTLDGMFVSDETFYPESQIEKVTDSTLASQRYIGYTKNEVIFHEESVTISSVSQSFGTNKRPERTPN